MVDITDNLMVDIPKSSEEITGADVADPDTLPRICGDYLLIRPVSTQIEKVGSIYMPEKMQEDVKYLHNVGRVLAFGPRAYKTKDGKTIDWVEGGMKIGDIVQWERFVGKRLRYKGVNLVLLRDTAVQMVVENQEDLDSLTSIEG
jgi:co-chaperonin GroES (HSP10)